jgi:hypothetical protein
MEDPKALQLFREVLNKTRSGRINWEASASEFGYFAVLPGGSLTLMKIGGLASHGLAGLTESLADNLLGRDYVLTLSGEEDQDLLRVTSQVGGVTLPEFNELFERAKRQALRVDAKVDRLLGELAKL